jgi:hypothetical protein
MVDLIAYERRGNLNAPFRLTRWFERTQREATRLSTARCEIPSLTWEAYLTGEPCPGCGLPYRDEEPWEFKGAMYFTDQERARYDAEDARLRKAHPDCQSGRHSVSGSLTTHCFKCCPMPPLSPRQREKIGRILSGPGPPHEQMRWRLRLYCGHVVEKRSHFKNTTLHSAFMGHTSCDQCGLDPSTIVDGEAIGLVAEPPEPETAARRAPVRGASGPQKPTRAKLEAKVRELEAEIGRLRDS